MIRITDILDKINEYRPEEELDIIERAYIYSARVHEGQVRLSGEPYLSHPLEVANILADMRMDVESIAAGLLHDVIEDTSTTKDDIQDFMLKNKTECALKIFESANDIVIPKYIREAIDEL